MGPHATTKAEAMADPRSTATTLVACLLDERDGESTGWDPATLAAEVAAMGVAQPSHAYDRMMAGVALVAGDGFYKSLPDFVSLVPPLCGLGFRPWAFEPLGCLEVACAITEALLLGPPEQNDDEPFNPELRLYLGHMLDREGIMNPPDVLAIAMRPAWAARRMAEVLAEYADDQDTRDAILVAEREKRCEINDAVAAHLKLIIDQLSALSLDNGDASALLGRLAKSEAR